jgi:hypothetical protein
MTSRSSEILEMEIVRHEVADRPQNSCTKSGYWDSARHQETLRTRYGSGNSQDNAIEVVVEFSGLEGVIEVCCFFHPTILFAQLLARNKTHVIILAFTEFAGARVYRMETTESTQRGLEARK